MEVFSKIHAPKISEIVFPTNDHFNELSNASNKRNNNTLHFYFF